MGKRGRGGGIRKKIFQILVQLRNKIYERVRKKEITYSIASDRETQKFGFGRIITLCDIDVFGGQESI